MFYAGFWQQKRRHTLAPFLREASHFADRSLRANGGEMMN
jgi:hypothetical protein